MTDNQNSSRRSRALRRALSLWLYFGVLTVASGVLLAQRVSAHLSEQSTALGRRLDGFQELSGRVTRLAFNGQALAVSTLVASQPVAQVLSRFIALCNADTTDLAQEIARDRGMPQLAGLVQRFLTLRDLNDDGTGSAVCLAGVGEGGLAGLGERARRFRASGDLAVLGSLRFAFVRKVDDAHTHVLLLSADGPLRLDRLVPREGHDAEGGDVVPGTRPPDAQRLLVASAAGTPHSLTVYRSKRAPDEALVAYGRQLGAARYARLPLPPQLSEQARAPDAVLTEAYRNGEQTFVVTGRSDGEGSLISVVRLGAQAIPHPAEAAEVGRALVGRGRLGGPRDPAFE